MLVVLLGANMVVLMCTLGRLWNSDDLCSQMIVNK